MRKQFIGKLWVYSVGATFGGKYHKEMKYIAQLVFDNINWNDPNTEVRYLD